MKRKITYPCIGIFVVFLNDKKWSANEPYKGPEHKSRIIERLTAWKEKNQEDIKKMLLYDNHSAESKEVILEYPQEFRLWLKYRSENREMAHNKEIGTSSHRMPALDAPSDYQVIHELVDKALDLIRLGVIWQAKLYGPGDTIIFHWTNMDGYLVGESIARSVF